MPGPLPRVACTASRALELTPAPLPLRDPAGRSQVEEEGPRGLLRLQGPGPARRAAACLPAASVAGGPQATAYTRPPLRLLLQTTSAVTSRVARVGGTVRRQSMLLGGSRAALPETGQLLK